MAWEPPSEDDFNENWLTPLDALEISDIHMADEHEMWAIVERLRAGQIIAVARTGQMRADIPAVRPLVLVHAGAWRRMNTNDEFLFWRTGDLSVAAAPNALMQGTGLRDRFFDIRFDPATLSGKPAPRVPDEAAIAGADAPPTNRGGAPRKGWWDDLWIEMIRRIQADTLHPKSGSDLQQIMLGWLGEQEIYPGDQTLKKMALKLFKYLQE